MISNVDARSVLELILTVLLVKPQGHKMRGKKPLDPTVASRIKAQIIICYIFSRQIMNKHNSFQPFHLPFPRNRDKEIHFKKKNNEQHLLPLSCTAARRSRLSPNVKDPQPRLRKSSRSVWDRSLTSAAIPKHSRNSLEELGADSGGYICGREAAGRPTFWCLQHEGFGQAPQDSDLLHPKSAHSCNIGWRMHIELQRAKQSTTWIMGYVLEDCARAKNAVSQLQN